MTMSDPDKRQLKIQTATISAPRKIMVLSKDQFLQAIMAKICNRYFGGEIYRAATPENPVEFNRLGGFDLIIVDLNLPGHSAVSIVRQLQQEQPSVPVIAVVGESDHDVDELKRLGISDIAYQPIRVAAFLEVAAGALMQKQNIYIN